MTRPVAALRGGHVHLDCASGAAGDMTLGALIDAGVPVEEIRAVLDRLGVGGDRLVANQVMKRGIRALDIKVRTDGRLAARRGGGGHGHEHEHGHGHEHGHAHGHASSHAHHPYRDIRAIIVTAALPVEVETRALDMFDRIARAEAHLHGTTVDQVAFHEVGAIDSIIDIVGTAAALAWLAPCAVTATSVAMGHGQLHCAHGMLPVPAPAALEILREAGGIMEDGGLARELCTPTGAAILASAVTAWTPMPSLIPLAVGYGAGDSELPDRANVMRAVIGRPVAVTAGKGHGANPALGADDSALAGAAGAEEIVWRIEANIDDMSPELCEHAAAAAFAAGALDVWWTPIVMKKGRPAVELSALAPEPTMDAVMTALLSETTTIGLRFCRMGRRVLVRESIEVDTPYGRLPIKLGRLGGDIVNAAPEYEPCRVAAQGAGVPLKHVFAAAVAAFHYKRRA